MRRTTALLIISTACIATLLCMAGCRSVKETTKIEPSITKKSTNCPYTNLSATFDVDVMGVSANGLLRTQCDSVIWVNLSKLIELGRVRFTKDSVVAYAKIYNRYYAGTYDDLYRLTDIQLSFAQLQKQIGEAYSKKLPETSLRINARQGRTTLTIKIRHIEATDEQLGFPLRIPQDAQSIVPMLEQKDKSNASTTQTKKTLQKKTK